MSKGLKVHIPQKLLNVVEAYREENKSELLEHGVIDNSDVVRHLVLKALKPFLEKHPELLKQLLEG